MYHLSEVEANTYVSVIVSITNQNLVDTLGDSTKEECFKCIFFQNVTCVCLLCYISADCWPRPSPWRTWEHPNWSFCRFPHPVGSVVSAMLLKSQSEPVTPLSTTLQSLLIALRVKPKFPTVA